MNWKKALLTSTTAMALLGVTSDVMAVNIAQGSTIEKTTKENEKANSKTVKAEGARVETTHEEELILPEKESLFKNVKKDGTMPYMMLRDALTNDELKDFIPESRISISNFDIGYDGGSRKTTTEDTDPLTTKFDLTVSGQMNPGDKIEAMSAFDIENKHEGTSTHYETGWLDGAEYDIALDDGTVIGKYLDNVITFNENVQGKSNLTFKVETTAIRARWLSSPSTEANPQPNIEEIDAYIYVNGVKKTPGVTFEVYGRPYTNRNKETQHRGTTRFLKYDPETRRVHFSTGVTLINMHKDFAADKSVTFMGLDDYLRFDYRNVNNGVVRVEEELEEIAAGDEFTYYYKGTKNIYGIGTLKDSTKYSTIEEFSPAGTGREGHINVSKKAAFDSPAFRMPRFTAFLKVSVPIEKLTKDPSREYRYDFGRDNSIQWEMTVRGKNNDAPKTITYNTAEGEKATVEKFEQWHHTVDIPEVVVKVIELDLKGTRQKDSEEKKIPYQTIYRFNPKLKPGEEKVIQNGKEGKIKIDYDVWVDGSGNEIGREETNRETTPPVDEIIETGNAFSEDDMKRHPFDTIYQPNDKEEVGYEKVIQEGEEGIEAKVGTEYTADGTKIKDGTWQVVQEPKDKIIDVGVLIKTPKELPFQRIRIIDPKLKEGEVVVEQEGVLGLETITEKIEIDSKTGKETARNEINRERVEPIDEIIRVGLGDPVAEESLKDKDKQQEEELPFETIERENPDLPEGERRVVQEGVPGKRIREVKVLIDEDGNILETLEVGDWVVVQEPVDEIIEIGTGKPAPEAPDAPDAPDKGGPIKRVDKPKDKDGKMKETGLYAVSGGIIGLLSSLGAFVGYKKRRK